MDANFFFETKVPGKGLTKQTKGMVGKFVKLQFFFQKGIILVKKCSLSKGDEILKLSPPPS